MSIEATVARLLHGHDRIWGFVLFGLLDDVCSGGSKDQTAMGCALLNCIRRICCKLCRECIRYTKHQEHLLGERTNSFPHGCDCCFYLGMVYGANGIVNANVLQEKVECLQGKTMLTREI